jgi:hypothetical protein
MTFSHNPVRTTCVHCKDAVFADPATYDCLRCGGSTFDLKRPGPKEEKAPEKCTATADLFGGDDGAAKA